jgi:acetyl esterase/lipase
MPMLTAFPVASKDPAGAVIICPGGGYSRRAEHEGAPVATWLNGLGLAAFLLDYRVAPHRHPTPLRDAQRAIRLVRHQADSLNIRADRVAILGFSAGGHLAATAGTNFDSGDPEARDPVHRMSSRPDLLVLCYPVISFGPFAHVGSMWNLLGDDPSADLRRQLSAETNVTRATPPTFLWHTADDPAVSVEHSLAFAAALHRNGVPFSLHVYPTGAHGLGLALDDPEVSSWTAHCADFLVRHGF